MHAKYNSDFIITCAKSKLVKLDLRLIDAKAKIDATKDEAVKNTLTLEIADTIKVQRLIENICRFAESRKTSSVCLDYGEFLLLEIEIVESKKQEPAVDVAVIATLIVIAALAILLYYSSYLYNAFR